MAGIKIEVFDNQADAEQRAIFFNQNGFTVNGPTAYRWATWKNNLSGENDKAMDLADLEVWLITAER